MQQPATRPWLLSPAAPSPGMLRLSPCQPADAQHATAPLLNAGLIPQNGIRFCTLRPEAAKRGKHSDATKMPPPRSVPPAPPAAGATASTG